MNQIGDALNWSESWRSEQSSNLEAAAHGPTKLDRPCVAALDPEFSAWCCFSITCDSGHIGRSASKKPVDTLLIASTPLLGCSAALSATPTEKFSLLHAYGLQEKLHVNLHYRKVYQKVQGSNDTRKDQTSINSNFPIGT